jgi:heptosyltransferase-2
MVMAQSLFKTIKKLYPESIIDVVAPEWALPVLERMPEVENGIALPVLHGQFAFFARVSLGKSLRDNNYTHAIVMPRSWKSALVPYFAGVHVRTGYRGEMRYGLLNDIRVLDKSVLQQTVQRYAAHAYDEKTDSPPDIPPKIPRPQLEVDQSNLSALLSGFELKLEKPVVCMMPGAEYGPAKQWPVEYYAELACMLEEKGYQVWVLGSAKEDELGNRIINNAGEAVINLCGKTSLVDVIDLLSCAEQVVTNDSGLMHVAAAVGVKLNVIYGSSTPAYTPPLAEDENLNIFYLNLECSPCFKRKCPLGHTNCLRKIKAVDVYNRCL